MATTNHKDVSSPKPPHSSCLNIRGNKSICLALATVHMCMFVYTCVCVYQCNYICIVMYIYMFDQLVSAEGNAQTLSFLSGAHLHVLLAPVASLTIVQKLEGCPLLTFGLAYSEVS